MSDNTYRREPIELIMRIEPNDDVSFREFVHCAECKHRPIWEIAVNGHRFAEAPEIERTTAGDLLKTAKKDYTCPFLWDSEGYYEMPEDDFFCKEGEKL